jgi:hypothetical protein
MPESVALKPGEIVLLSGHDLRRLLNPKVVVEPLRETYAALAEKGIAEALGHLWRPFARVIVPNHKKGYGHDAKQDNSTQQLWRYSLLRGKPKDRLAALVHLSHHCISRRQTSSIHPEHP